MEQQTPEFQALTTLTSERGSLYEVRENILLLKTNLTVDISKILTDLDLTIVQMSSEISKLLKQPESTVNPSINNSQSSIEYDTMVCIVKNMIRHAIRNSSHVSQIRRLIKREFPKLRWKNNTLTECIISAFKGRMKGNGPNAEQVYQFVRDYIEQQNLLGRFQKMIVKLIVSKWSHLTNEYRVQLFQDGFVKYCDLHNRTSRAKQREVLVDGPTPTLDPISNIRANKAMMAQQTQSEDLQQLDLKLVQGGDQRADVPKLLNIATRFMGLLKSDNHYRRLVVNGDCAYIEVRDVGSKQQTEHVMDMTELLNEVLSANKLGKATWSEEGTTWYINLPYGNV